MRSKELECDPNIQEVRDPILEDQDDESSSFDVQRENPVEHAELHVIGEPVELVDEPPTKWRSTWCQYVLRDVEKNGAPVGTSRECKQPDRFQDVLH